ncbi:aminomethyltransferase [Tepidamorphus gemmatus]|uniref:Aminomethyltransferase n=1 Tax=Tepidamorphus gemmatus TaxID=747076 RepID=A0A4R3MG49_9HYPH|nr:aminomethyltransferase family protein [Tepidamorphus gemmatus]TCT10605.1 aminomethyltransferase [Tepidamorphus gemmatus]
MTPRATPLPRDHFLTPLWQTPFHPRIATLSQTQQWYAWAGYQAAQVIRDAEQEYFAIRNAASLFDITPMVKYRIEGPDAEAFCDRLTVRDVTKLKAGRVQYTCWCDDEGKVLDDGTLFRFSPTEFRLCCQERHLNWLLDSAIGFEVEIAEVTEEIAGLSLQGPTSFAVLNAAGFAGLDTMKPFDIRRVAVAGLEVTISRTGFTGDLGYELFVAPGEALALWDLLVEAGCRHGITAIGYAALNLARLEAGFIVANADFVTAETAIRADRRRSPYEIGLGRLVALDKQRHFNGRRALAREAATGASRYCLVGLDIDGNVPADHALVYHRGRREVGHITAGAWSPTTKRNIAIASLERPYGDTVTDDLWVEIYAMRELAYQKLMVRARIVDRPFFVHPRRTATPPGTM